MTNTTASAYGIPVAGQVDDHGELFEEKAPHGPCEGMGMYDGCAGIGDRVICPLDSDYHGVKRWAYLCDHCHQQRIWDV